MTMYLTILGSGAALPTGRRRCAAQLLNVGGFKMLIDCSEGTQDRIRYYHIKMQSISTIIISHLHGDHFFGLAGLLNSMHLCGRSEPITIVAPQGAREVIETTFRLTGSNIGFDLEWVEMDFKDGEQRVFENKYCTVDAFPITHSVPTYGFRISSEFRVQSSEFRVENGELRTVRGERGSITPHSPLSKLTYAYCCDTIYDESIVPHIAGADLLCLECTFSNELADLAAKRFHLTAGQAGHLAQMAGVNNLLLSHISARYKEPEILLEQATAEFQNCILAADGMRVEVTKKVVRTITQYVES